MKPNKEFDISDVIMEYCDDEEAMEFAYMYMRFYKELGVIEWGIQSHKIIESILNHRYK